MSLTSPMRQALAAVAVIALGATGALAQEKHDHAGHAHDHTKAEQRVHDGYFDDAQIAMRDLTDWSGDWQSVYPLLQDGTLDPVMAHKAEGSDRTAADYRAYYDTGYRTDVERIVIGEGTVTFHDGDSVATGTYVADGYEVLTYEKGNRGVRFVFRKEQGSAAAPEYIQFSDHIIAPQTSDHYHLYWGDDRAALLEELTNWPTYYPAHLTGSEIVDVMIAH